MRRGPRTPPPPPPAAAPDAAVGLPPAAPATPSQAWRQAVARATHTWQDANGRVLQAASILDQLYGLCSSVTGEGTTPTSSAKPKASRPVQTKGRGDRGKRRQKNRKTRRQGDRQNRKTGRQRETTAGQQTKGRAPTNAQPDPPHPNTRGPHPPQHPRPALRPTKERGGTHRHTRKQNKSGVVRENLPNSAAPPLYSRHRGLTTALSKSPGAGPIT